MARSRIISQQLGLLINFLILLSIAPVILCRPPTKNIFPKPSLERRQPDDIEPSAGGKVHTITVGRAAHMFKPDSVKAAIGDVIKFEFYPTNHSVIRASFDSPCIPREMMEPNADGFFSGWFPMDTVQEKPPTWSWKVDTNDPVFFYCGGEDSCKYWGMVGVINPSEEQTVEEFAKNAKKAQYQLSPGEPFPDEAVNKPNSPSQKASKSSKDTLSTGAIVGIALAAVTVVVVFGIIFYFLGKWRNSKKNNASAQNQALLYAQPGAHEGIEVLYSRLPMVQPVAASYYDYSRGDARIGSYYDPPNALHVSSAYMSSGSRYSQTVAGSQKGTPSGSPLAQNRAELRTQAFSPVELAGTDDNR